MKRIITAIFIATFLAGNAIAQEYPKAKPREVTEEKTVKRRRVAPRPRRQLTEQEKRVQRNRAANKAYSRSQRQGLSDNQAQADNLAYSVRDFVAETGFVRAHITVTNNGKNPSDPSRMYVEFTDGFDKPFASTEATIGSLNPGQSKTIEAFSLIRDSQKNVNGVQRSVTGDNVLVNFFSLTNRNKNPRNAADAKTRRRTSKKTKGLDFNKGYPKGNF